MGQGHVTYGHRLCTKTYSCNGMVESRVCGEWQGCPTGGEYHWQLINEKTIGPLSAVLLAALVPPIPNPFGPAPIVGPNIVGPEHIIAACAIGGTIGTLHGSSWPETQCNADAFGSSARTFVFRLAPLWQQLLLGPPVCEMLVSDYQCVRS